MKNVTSYVKNCYISNFHNFYEKVEYDTKGIKVIINSEILNSIQKQVSGMSPTSEIYLVYFKEQNLTENSKKN